MVYIIVIETNFKTENSIKNIFYIYKKKKKKKKNTIDQIRFVFLAKRTCVYLDLKGN